MGFIQSAPKHANESQKDNSEKNIPATKQRPKKIKTKITASREIETKKLKERKDSYGE